MRSDEWQTGLRKSATLGPSRIGGGFSCLKLLSVFILTLATHFVAALDAFAVSLFAVTLDNRIKEFDADSGTVLNAFAPPVDIQVGGGNALAYSGTSLYYTTINSNDIYRLNPSSGQVEQTFPVPAPVGTRVDALGCGYSNFGSTLFALDYEQNRIVLLNPLTGMEMSSYIVPFDAVGGLDYSPVRDSIYVSAGQANRIYEINPNTGAILNSFSVEVTPMLTGIGLIGERLFTAQRNNSPTNFIIERDPVTGAALNSFVSDGGFASALAGDPNVPEPPSLLHFGVAVVGSIFGRRRYGRAIVAG